MENRCLTVQLTSQELIDACVEAAMRAASDWRTCGISEALIRHVLEHLFPGISPEFVDQDKLILIGVEAARLLEAVLIKVDGIGREGKVNILAK